MSDQRPEWMPSDDAIRACSAVDHVESANMKLYVVTATGALLHKTGLRAQLFKLEELSAVFVLLRVDRLTNPGLHAICTTIEEEIAALRKELE